MRLVLFQGRERANSNETAPLVKVPPGNSSAVDFPGRFNQFNFLLAPDVKDSELFKKKGYEFKIRGWRAAPLSYPPSPYVILLPLLQGFSIKEAFATMSSYT